MSEAPTVYSKVNEPHHSETFHIKGATYIMARVCLWRVGSEEQASRKVRRSNFNNIFLFTYIMYILLITRIYTCSREQATA